MSQEQTTIQSNFNLRGGLPPRHQVGALDPDIFGEGQRVIMNEGDASVAYTPPPEKLSTPDWSEIKSIRKYFGRRDYQVFPSWFYHPSEEPRLMKTSDQAKHELGVFYRKATFDEKGRTGLSHVWDWEEGSQWRAHPYKTGSRNLLKEQGKLFEPVRNVAQEQNTLIESLIPAVAAAVAQSLKATGPAAPASIDPKQWEAFLQFQAFQEAAKAVDQVKTANALASGPALAVEDEDDDGGVIIDGHEDGTGTLALTAEEQKQLWTAEAERKGIKVDGRWSLERLIAECEKVA